MGIETTCHNIRHHRAKPNDKIYTPLPVALTMIDMCDVKPEMKVLDPCKGGGVFYDNLPPCNKYYCEIDEDKDFFQFDEKVDLIIGNPPYSLWSQWLSHTSTITDKFCYLIGLMNLTPERINEIHKMGFGITKIKILKVHWWFLQSVIVICERGKSSIIECISERIYCDKCNTKCARGQTKKGIKYPPNHCPIVDGEL